MTTATKQKKKSNSKENKNELLVEATRVFYENLNCDKKIVVNVGGTRSSKTYSILLLFLTRLINHGIANLRFLICRKTSPSLKKSVKKTFDEIVEKLNLNNILLENKQMMEYNYLKSSLIFSGIDEASKIRSTEFNYIFMEEADEFTYEDFRVLILRLSRQNPIGRNQIFLAFNPVDSNSWIKKMFFDKENKDCAIIHSTYKDNPFLSEDYIKMIEQLKEEDPEYWKIYGLGEFAKISSLIYDEPVIVSEIPETEEVIYGLDFGFTNPTALVEVRIKEKDIYVKELLYETNLTNEQLINKLKELIQDKTRPIYADAEEPARIEEIYQAGFNIFPSEKKVKDGIDFVKRFKIHCTNEDVNFLKEIRTYKWQNDRQGNIIDKPVKFNDHLLDALRYAVYTHLKDRVVFNPKEKFNEIKNYFDEESVSLETTKLVW